MRFVVTEGVLRLLLVIKQLHVKLAAHPSAAAIDIVLLSRRTLQAAASTICSGKLPIISAQPLSFSSLIIGGKQSRLRIAHCDLWAQALATSGTRVLWIPALHSFIGQVTPIDKQDFVVSQLLAGFRERPQLYPPQCWGDFEHKDRLYKEMGFPFMLPALWLPLISPSNDALQAAEEQLLRGQPDGEFMVKGGYSHGGRTAHRITISQGRCILLTRVLRFLFTTLHQRCVGIQPFVASLCNSEQRVFIVPDEHALGGWRQCFSVHSRCADNSFSVHTVQLRQPTSGMPMRIARFVDQLLLDRADFFSRAKAVGMPLLRLDCGFTNRQGCFLNEISSAGNATLFTDVHEQELALVAAECFAAQMWEMMQ
jgi:hypothetical protein